MLIDAQNIFSDNQAITEAAVISDNIVDFGKGDISYLPLYIAVSNDFKDLTSLKVSIQTSDEESFSSPVTLVESTLKLEELKRGARFPISRMPLGNKGYIRIQYTAEGTTETEGKITAGVSAGNEFSWHNM